MQERKPSQTERGSPLPQSHGVAHIHAVVRLGGPHDPETAPTAWATAELLAEAVGRAAARVSVTVEGPSGLRRGRSVGRADRWATDSPRSLDRGGRANRVHGICWIWSGREELDLRQNL